MVINHVILYNSPYNINNYWNIGFITYMFMIIQIVSGIIISILYLNQYNAFISIYYIIIDIYYSYSIYYIHNVVSSYIIIALNIHIYKNFIYIISSNSIIIVLTGYYIYNILIVALFLGYILIRGQTQSYL